jgi:hypothetical protein
MHEPCTDFTYVATRGASGRLRENELLGILVMITGASSMKVILHACPTAGAFLIILIPNKNLNKLTLLIG